MSQELRKKMFNVFKPDEALRPGDPCYVECSKERGSDDLLSKLADTIRLSLDPTSQLLSGHRGCGKTTELFRLQRDLLTNAPRYFVVYCESDQYVDPNDVEYTDVLLAMVQQIGADARQQDIGFAPSRFQTFWSGLWNVLTSPVEPKDVKFGVGGVDFGFDIKRNPNNRLQVRNHLRPQVTTFLEAVNEVIQEAEQRFRAKGYEGLVVIVDNLDRVFRNTDPITRRTSHDTLFVDAAEHLRSSACHVIYTVPPALLHSPNGARLTSLYGRDPQMLPMIPVAARNGDEHKEGMAKLIEAIQNRLLYVGTTSVSAFDGEPTIRRLCAASGGYMRSLLSLARAATTYAKTLPLTADAVDSAIRDVRDSYIRAMGLERQWQILREVASTKGFVETEDSLQLLENFAVLEYRDLNGPWYDVNPVVREAPQFKP